MKEYAFPCGFSPEGNSADQHGMTLRAYVAAQVVKGFCANPAVFGPNPTCGWRLVNATEDQLADYACLIADKVIAAARKGGGA